MHWRNVFSTDQNDDTTTLWNVYLDKIYPHLNICENKTVLEIGPFNGAHTQVIKSHNPKKITLVELASDALIRLRNDFPDCEIIEDDIFHYLEQARGFDVVVCCGVLYHFHSPLHLLELIVNRISPTYICIETFPSGNDAINIEDDNTLGARQLLDGWRSANISIKLPKETIITAMKNLGYRIHTRDDTLTKPNSPELILFCVFEKI